MKCCCSIYPIKFLLAEILPPPSLSEITLNLSSDEEALKSEMERYD